MMEPTPKLNDAVAKVMGAVARLAKGDVNKFASYRYTSIDDFKDAMRPLMAANGLVLSLTEHSAAEHMELSKPKGGTELVMRFVFALHLEHTSGERGPVELSTVMLPYTGAQTTGIAKSYAVKEWCKSKFLASCGDEDADKLKTDEYGRAANGNGNGHADLTGNANVKGYKPPATATSQAAQDARAAAEYATSIMKQIDEIQTEAYLDEWYDEKRTEMNARLARSYVSTVRDKIEEKRMSLQGAEP